MDCAIVAKTKDAGLELLWKAKEIVPALYERYKNPYKLEYLTSMIEKKLGDDLAYFHESEYGDQVDPFTYG